MSNNPIVDVPALGQALVDKNGALTQQGQSLIESIELDINSGKRNEYTVATVPDATKCKGCSIIVTDAAVGYTEAWSNGTVWKVPTANVTLT
jgi:hypothetical protein